MSTSGEAEVLHPAVLCRRLHSSAGHCPALQLASHHASVTVSGWVSVTAAAL